VELTCFRGKAIIHGKVKKKKVDIPDNLQIPLIWILQI